jgi:holo-[acyl-carrier protein] synthase
MPIVGHGIDIVPTHRIAALLEEHGERFTERCFTPAELGYCRRQRKRLVEHLAGRFAAKEAILKALGTGWSGGIAWTDMEILPDPAGRPVLTLTGETARRAMALGIARWHISISHVEESAVASAIAEGP